MPAQLKKPNWNHRHSHIKLTATLLLMAVAMSACVSTKQLDDRDRARINSVKISPEVKRPAEMYYFGPGASIGFAFGAVGGVVAAASQIGPGQELLVQAEKNEIRIERIVAEEFEQALHQSGKIKITDSSDAQAASISITVVLFGFSVPNGFSSKLVPVIALIGEMRDASGNIIWAASENLSPLGNPVDPMSPDALRADPKMIESAWRTAARHLSRVLVEAM